MKTVSYTKKGPGRITKQKKVKKMEPVNGSRKWIEGGNPCDDLFIERFPDFSYEGSTSLNLWRMAWQASRDALETEEKPKIQLI